MSRLFGLVAGALVVGLSSVATASTQAASPVPSRNQPTSQATAGETMPTTVIQTAQGRIRGAVRVTASGAAVAEYKGDHQNGPRQHHATISDPAQPRLCPSPAVAPSTEQGSRLRSRRSGPGGSRRRGRH